MGVYKSEQEKDLYEVKEFLTSVIANISWQKDVCKQRLGGGYGWIDKEHTPACGNR
jgi:hypothetical protein